MQFQQVDTHLQLAAVAVPSLLRTLENNLWNVKASLWTGSGTERKRCCCNRSQFFFFFCSLPYNCRTLALLSLSSQSSTGAIAAIMCCIVMDRTFFFFIVTVIIKLFISTCWQCRCSSWLSVSQCLGCCLEKKKKRATQTNLWLVKTCHTCSRDIVSVTEASSSTVLVAFPAGRADVVFSLLHFPLNLPDCLDAGVLSHSNPQEENIRICPLATTQSNWEICSFCEFGQVVVICWLTARPHDSKRTGELSENKKPGLLLQSWNSHQLNVFIQNAVRIAFAQQWHLSGVLIS